MNLRRVHPLADLARDPARRERLSDGVRCQLERGKMLEVPFDRATDRRWLVRPHPVYAQTSTQGRLVHRVKWCYSGYMIRDFRYSKHNWRAKGWVPLAESGLAPPQTQSWEGDPVASEWWAGFYTGYDFWCGTGPNRNPVFVDEPDFVCKRCEENAVEAGYLPTLAFPETGCEAWRGTRFQTNLDPNPLDQPR